MKRVALAAASLTLLCACGQPGPTVPSTIGANPPAQLRANDFPVTALNAPSSVFPGVKSTEPTGIRPLLVTATVTLKSGATVGGLYNRRTKTWSQITYPGAASTAVYGPESILGGYRVVGSYQLPNQNGDSAFIYDSTTKQYTTLNAPSIDCAPASCSYTIAHSIYGGGRYLVVGNYDAAVASSAAAGHAFLYDSATQVFENIDVYGAISTTAYGIWMDGKSIAVAGGYTDTKGTHAYVRDLTSGKMLTYDYPRATLTHFEGITGAGGAGSYSLVGDYTKPRDKGVYGFFLNVRGWKAWPPIVIGKLSANSVSVRDVIGVYRTRSGISGYVTTLPVQDPP